MEYEEFLLKELFEAYGKARVGGKRKTMDEHRFEMNDIENICRLKDAIMMREYRPSRGVAFIVHDPVTREVFAAPFIDRIVHHFLFKFAAKWWEPRLIPASYSCRKGKGTLYGIKDLQRKIRRVSENGTKGCYVIKRDLRGYFMSLDHEKLYERVAWGLDRQFPERGELYSTLKFLWKQIIFDDPISDVKIRGRKSDWDDLPPDKSLFYTTKSRGIVIGNLTSQLLSNIYLDQLDRFIVIELGYRNYGRYVDDFFIVVGEDELEKVRSDLCLVEDFVNELGLVIHPKKKYDILASNGVDFLGAKVFADHILPGERIARKFAEAVYKFATTGDGKIEGIGSYDGHLAHYDSYELIKKVYNGVGWEYVFPKLK